MAEENEKKIEAETFPEKEVKKNEEKVKKVANLEDDEDSLIEEDGDFFWILQRVIWGILKTLVILGFIGGALWLIWGNKSVFESSKKTKKPTSKIEIPIKEDEIPRVLPERTQDGSVESFYAFEIAKKAYEIESNRVTSQPNILTDSIFWLRKAKSLGEVSPIILRIQSPEIRAKKIEETLIEAELLLTESVLLQKRLQQDLVEFSKINKTKNELIFLLSSQINGEIQKLEPQHLSELLWKKIKAQKESLESASQGEIRNKLLKNIQNFDRLLRSKSLPMFNPQAEIRATPK